jgi:hypothetical protein
MFPELLKGFLPKIGADGLEIVAKEIAQPEVLAGARSSLCNAGLASLSKGDCTAT